MKSILIGMLAALLTAGAESNEAERQLKAVMNAELVNGDLRTAIKQYGEIAAKYKNDRAVAAMALVRMAEAYQKMGDTDAKKVYERVMREYGDQKEAVSLARARLGGSSQGSGTLSTRLVPWMSYKGLDIEDVTLDGRFGSGTNWSNGDLVTVDMTTGKTTTLLAGTLDGRTLGSGAAKGKYVSWSRFSPDQKQVVFAQYGDDVNTAFWVIDNRPGAKPRKLIDSPEFNNFWGPSWSPDSKSVLVQLVRKDGAVFAWVSIADGKLTRLKSFPGWDQSPDYRTLVSPDGKFIAYCLETGQGAKNKQLLILASDGSSESLLAQTGGVNESPAWTPDGRHIVFVSNRSGTFDLWAIPVRDGRAAGPPFRVKQNIGRVNGTIRGGSYYYSLRDIARDRIPYITTAEISNGRAAKVSADSLVGLRPTWSPDGKSLAFKRIHSGVENAWDLVIHSLETGEERTITTTLGYTGPGGAKWLHNGSGVFQGLVQDGKPGLYRVDLKTQAFEPVPIPGLAEVDRTWYAVAPGENKSPDAPNPATITARNLSNGEVKPVFTIPDVGTVASFASPDGRMLAITRTNGPYAYVATVGADGSGFREFYKDARAAFGGLGWAPDGRSLFVGRRRDAAVWDIVRVWLDRSNVEPIGLEVEGVVQSIDVSSDGSRIAVSALRGVQELWALDNILSVLK